MMMSVNCRQLILLFLAIGAQADNLTGQFFLFNKTELIHFVPRTPNSDRLTIKSGQAKKPQLFLFVRCKKFGFVWLQLFFAGACIEATITKAGVRGRRPPD